MPLLDYLYLLSFTKMQGQLTEAESIFNLMKMAECPPDVVTYTAMLHAYSAVGKIVSYH